MELTARVWGIRNGLENRLTPSQYRRILANSPCIIRTFYERGCGTVYYITGSKEQLEHLAQSFPLTSRLHGSLLTAASGAMQSEWKPRGNLLCVQTKHLTELEHAQRMLANANYNN